MMRSTILQSLLLLLVVSGLISDCTSHKQMVSAKSSFDDMCLEEITISQLQAGYRDGCYTVKDVVAAYIDRINEIDKNGPALNSIIMVNPDAISIAEELDREIKEGRIRGPLHGIPVVLKDNIDTHDRMPTTAGATVLRNSFPASDSFVAKKLREAGAVILAKANLSEWANYRASPSSSGWSAIGGQTKNPYILDRNPCGSSSGSGVAVSANLCVVGIGTETNASIVCPANNNGIVGIKPTVGLISRSGIIPISFTQDTPGPLTRTVEDAAICLGALTGIDQTDPKSLASTGMYPEDYTQFLKTDGLKGKRIGYYKRASGYSDAVDELVKKAIEQMELLGATVIDINDNIESGYGNASSLVLSYEFKDGLRRYFERLGDKAPVKNLKELIEFNLKDSIELKYFNQKVFERSEARGDLDDPEYKKALATMLKASRDDGIDRIMNINRLDALIAPTGAPAWKTDLILGDRFIGGSSSPAAVSGYPAISLPMGFIKGLPVGITFFGRAWSEPVLLEAAYSYEQATRHRKAPGFIPTDN